MTNATKFFLGGAGSQSFWFADLFGDAERRQKLHVGFVSVNLARESGADVKADVRNLDKFCRDGHVEHFHLHHTLEHLPRHTVAKFYADLYRKLRPGGIVTIRQTDVYKLLQLHFKPAKGQKPLDFRALIPPIFTPGNIVQDEPLQQHQFPYWPEGLKEEMEAFGFEVEILPTTYWAFDQKDDVMPDVTFANHGYAVPELNVVARKPL